MHLFIEYAQQFRRFQRNARLYLISNVLSGVTTGILLVLYNLYLVSLGYHTDFIGAVLFIGSIGAGLAIFPAGVCIDRFSGKAILIWASALIGVAGAGQILFRQPLPLLVSAFMVGVGVAFMLVVNAPFLTANSTPGERPHLFSMNISLGLATLVLGEVLGGALPAWLHSFSWLMAPLPPWASLLLASQPDPRSYQLALLFAGAIAAPSFIPLFMLTNDRPSRGILPSRVGGRGVHALRGGGGGDEGRGCLHRPGLGSIPSAAHIHTLLHTPFFFLTLVYILTGSPSLFGLIDGGANAITALFTLAAPGLAKRLGRINTIALTRLASIPLLLTIGLTSILPLAALLYLFRQGAMDMSAGILQVYSMEAVSQKNRGVANSSYQAAFQAPQAIAAPIGGLLIVQLGYPPIFLLGAFLYILTIIILLGRFGRGKSGGSAADDTSSPIIHETPV